MDSLEIKSPTSTKSDFYYEDGSNPKIISEEVTIHNPSNKAIYNTSHALQNPKPLIIVDGKEISHDALRILKPDHIESMTILKDESATKKYGDKGINGVIIIKLKPEVIRTDINSVTFIDDNDTSKNASVAYISKYTPDNVLEDYKSSLLKIGVIVKYSKLKRNKSGNITSIKIILEDGKGSKSSATWKVTDGIPNIEFGKSEDTLIARTKG
jgi:TonB-dependent SusC/RagA subfamily outer membrane receptor